MGARIVTAELRPRAEGLRRAGWLLVLTDDQGTRGAGEASPLPGFSREPPRAAHAALRAASRALEGIDLDRAPTDVEGAIRAMLEGLAPLLSGSPSAAFAVEVALFDLLCRRAAIPVHVALGASRAQGRPVSGLASCDAGGAELVARARALFEAGIATIKVKMRSADDEAFASALRALEELRRALPAARLRVDPNGAWPLERARARLEALAPLDVEYVEQPVAADKLAGLGRTATAWAADESLRIPDIRTCLLEERACSVFVLKPQLHGGLLAALDLAREARARGIDSVATHAFEGTVGLAACAELALALGGDLAVGLDPDYLPPGARTPPQLSERGRVKPAGPGLSVGVP